MIRKRLFGNRRAPSAHAPWRAAHLALLGALLGGALGGVESRAASPLLQIPGGQAAGARSVLLNAELTRPEGKGPFPAVVMMHGCGGWQPAVLHGLRQHAEFLRKNGFVVLNIDSFGPRGNSGGAVCSSFDALREARDYRTFDAFAALRYLQSLDFVDGDRVFLIGQSNGGSVALRAAEAGATARYGRGDRGFRGVVAYYPWCGTLGTDSFALEAPLLVFGGARDDWVPPDECQRFQATGAELSVKVYPRAAHSFDLLAPEHRYLGKLIGFDREATEDSRARMLGFFRRHATDLRVVAQP